MPENIQNQEANFTNIDEGEESVALNRENVKVTKIVDDAIAPMIFKTPVCYITIATSDDEIEDEYSAIDYF